MERFINVNLVAAAQMTTPEDNPLVTDSSRMMDVWFNGEVVRKQLFRKVSKEEQNSFIDALSSRGFIKSGNLYINPAVVMLAEMEHPLVGGLVTIGFGDNGKAVELKVKGAAFTEIVEKLQGI